MRRSTGNYSYPYMALLSLLSLWTVEKARIRKAESVNNDKIAKGDIKYYWPFERAIEICYICNDKLLFYL